VVAGVLRNMREFELRRGDRLVVFDRFSERLLRGIMKTPLEIMYHPGLKLLDEANIRKIEARYRAKRTFLLFPLLIDGLVAGFFRNPFSKLKLGKRSVLLYRGTTRKELEGYAKRKQWTFPMLLSQHDSLDSLVKDFPSVRHAFGKALENLERKS